MRAAQAAGRPPAVDGRWTGLRCRIQVASAGAGWQVDLRTKAPTRRARWLTMRSRGPSAWKVRVHLSSWIGLRRHRGDRGLVGCRGPRGGSVKHRRRWRRMTFVLDALDQLAADGVRRLRRPQGPGAHVQGPVPGADLRRRVPARPLLRQHRRGGDRRKGSQIVERQLRERTVRAGEEELFKSRARETRHGQAHRPHHAPGSTPRPTPTWRRCRACSSTTSASTTELVRDNERMLTGGFYAEVELEYDAAIAQEKNGRPVRHRSRCGRSSCPSATCWTTLVAGRARFTTERVEAIPAAERRLRARARSRRARRTCCCCAWCPFVERNYNMVELGPRGTGKSHLFQQVSPYAHLVSGGKATVARMFVNNATGQRGLVCQYDVVCFDEVSGVSFDQKDGVNIMKGYMESGEFSRGQGEHPRRRRHRHGRQLRRRRASTSSGSATCSARCRRRCATTPPSWTASTPTCPAGTSRRSSRDALHRPLRPGQRLPLRVLDASLRAQSRLHGAPGPRALRRRAERPRHDRRQQDGQRAAEAALPRSRDAGPGRGPGMGGAAGAGVPAAGEGAAEADRLAPSSATRTSATRWASDGVEKFVVTPELQSEDSIGSDPLPPGQVWAISPGGAGRGRRACSASR